MAADAKARWIKKHGEKKSVKEWLEAHPPPPEFEGSPLDYAFAEMEEEPIDDPIEPDFEEFPEGKYVTRAEHDALRAQVASSTRKVRNAIKKARRSEPPPPPPLPPTPSPKRANGLAAILAPLARRK